MFEALLLFCSGVAGAWGVAQLVGCTSTESALSAQPHPSMHMLVVSKTRGMDRGRKFTVCSRRRCCAFEVGEGLQSGQITAESGAFTN